MNILHVTHKIMSLGMANYEWRMVKRENNAIAELNNSLELVLLMYLWMCARVSRIQDLLLISLNLGMGDVWNSIGCETAHYRTSMCILNFQKKKNIVILLYGLIQLLSPPLSVAADVWMYFYFWCCCHRHSLAQIPCQVWKNQQNLFYL